MAPWRAATMAPVPIHVPWVDGLEPFKVAVTPRPEGGARLPRVLAAMRAQGVEVVVSMLEPKEQEWLDLATQHAACVQAGIDYVSCPVQDRGIPRGVEHILPVARRLARELSAGRGVLFHCFAGIGRSPLMAACTLAVLGVAPLRALEAISRARGLPVPDTDEQRAFVLEFARGLTIYGGQ